MTEFPISINYDETQLPVGMIRLNDTAMALAKLHEYVILPIALIQKGEVPQIVGYSLIHRRNYMSPDRLAQIAEQEMRAQQ